jgi:hypothetical protein
MASTWRGQYYRYRDFSYNLLAIYKQRADVQAFLEIILSLSTLIIFVIFAIKPTALTMVSLNKEINAKEQTLAELNQKITNLQIANSNYSQNSQYLPDIDNAIFSKPQPDTVSKQIMGMAIKNGVTVSGISIGETVIVGKYKNQSAQNPNQTSVVKPLPDGAYSLPVSISINGEYANIKQFLIDIENVRVPIKIDNIILGTSKSENETNITELINARIPYLGK